MRTELTEQPQEHKLEFDPEEISILLIGNEEEQDQAISLIDKYLCKPIISKIRETAISLSFDEVKDVYQETLLNILETARKGRYDPDKHLLPFLFTLAYRRACDRIRKNTVLAENEGQLIDEISNSLKDTKVGEAWEIVAKKHDGSKMMGLIRKAIMRMPYRQRQVASIIIEHFPETPQYQEVCDEVYERTGEKITVVSVKRAWQEARKKIRDLLKDAGYLEEI